MNKNDLLNQIRKVTQILTKKSLSTRYNFPKEITLGELVWENYQNIAFSLKEEPYDIMYEACRKEGDYNLMLLDGAIIQMKYRFNKRQLLSHVLAFYPNPDLENFQDNPEYEAEHYDSNKLFTDIIDKSVVPFPIRFDYDDESHTDCEHPKVHATLGNNKNCRIPVSHPISPNRFILFILRNFYFEKFKETFQEDIKKELQQKLDRVNFKGKTKVEIEKLTLKIENELLNNQFDCNLKMVETISPNEKNLIHFSSYK